MKSSKYRVFYVVLGSVKHGVITRPFDRVKTEVEARAEALKEPGAFFLSATEYRELTGRDAAADYAREMEGCV